tara:strand:+ start:3287 stop:4078 length:792 start_codon:yes stop_codon:yes gene_type:complete
MIYVLGSTGMLGRYVTKYLNANGLHREDFDATQGIELTLEEHDIVINCVGILKPYIEQVGIVDTIKINSIFPQLVSDQCKAANAKFIHICSDCVFSGAKGQYIETDVCDATDLYAKTKSIEPTDATIIRTSFIGEDINEDSAGLLEWVKSQHTIDGYTNCYWNGVTALQLAKVIDRIIRERIWWTGIRHIFSNTVSKYDLCNMINDAYNLNIRINRVEAESIAGTEINGVLNRSLSTLYTIDDFDIPSLEVQLHELVSFNKYF